MRGSGYRDVTHGLGLTQGQLWLLEIQRIDVVCLQTYSMAQEGSSTQARYWQDSFLKPGSGTIRTMQDCCGEGAYFPIFLGVIE